MKLWQLVSLSLFFSSCHNSSTKNVNPESPELQILEFSTAQTQIELVSGEHQEIIVHWKTNNAETCLIKRQQPMETLAAEPASGGSRSFFIELDSDFTLLCHNFSGQEKQVTFQVRVQAKPKILELATETIPEALIKDLNADPSSFILAPNQSAITTISWDTENADSCQITRNNQIISADAITGTIQVDIAESTELLMTCKNSKAQFTSEKLIIPVTKEVEKKQFCMNIVVWPKVGDKATVYDFFDKPSTQTLPRNKILDRDFFNGRFRVGSDAYLRSDDVMDACDPKQSAQPAILAIADTQFLQSKNAGFAKCPISAGTILNYKSYQINTNTIPFGLYTLNEPNENCPYTGTEGFLLEGLVIRGYSFLGYSTGGMQKIMELRSNPPRIIELSSDKTTVEIIKEELLNLTWKSNLADTCEIKIPQMDNKLYSNLPTNGSLQISISKAVSIQLICSNINGLKSEKSLDIQVKKIGPFITSFSANLSEINSLPSTGSQLNLSWSSQNTDKCVMNQIGVDGSLQLTATGVSYNVPVKGVAQFKLTCYLGSVASESVSLNIPFVNVCSIKNRELYFKDKYIYRGFDFYQVLIQSGACLKHRAQLTSDSILIDGKQAFYSSNFNFLIEAFTGLARSGAFTQTRASVKGNSITIDGNEAFYFNSDETRATVFRQLAESGAFTQTRASVKGNSIT
ncbi:MAG: hypothetical protein NTX25_03285, partial [Proteobacteria bacterium]|nr:hypothetical protein [Pseudomonadota bacterium]